MAAGLRAGPETGGFGTQGSVSIVRVIDRVIVVSEGSPVNVGPGTLAAVGDCRMCLDFRLENVSRP